MIKNLPANAGATGDAGSIPGLGRSPGGGNGNHSSILAWGNPMDRGSLLATIYGVKKELDKTKQLSMHAII